MSLATYGVLKCRALERKIDPVNDPSPHYQVLVSDGDKEHRIAINVKSQQSPSDLLYLVNESFHHSILGPLANYSRGFHKLDHKPGGVALDFIRRNLFRPEDMKPLPLDIPGPSNDLKELIDLYVQRAIQTEDAVLYAFGAAWGPEQRIQDKYFGFLPSSGIHDIHMNQGSIGRFQQDNGVYQDGGLLIQFPSRNQWIAIFLAFQSQCLHTDDRSGNQIKQVCQQPQLDASVRILAGLVNPLEGEPSKQTVTLMNVSPGELDLNGWAIADKQKRKFRLPNLRLKAGSSLTIPLTGPETQLSKEEGIITLLDAQGIKVDGVSYTKEQAQKAGWTILF
jgi:uncharacterized protein YukJ